jgi:hypothetical protein
MEITPKSPQEIAAQSMDAYPFFDETVLGGDAKQLKDQAKSLEAELKGADPYRLSDDELDATLKDLKSRAEQSGVWRVNEGSGAEDRIAFAVEKNIAYGASKEEAAELASKQLGRNGILDAIRRNRREQERLFKDPIEKYVGEHQLEPKAEEVEIASLLDRTIDISTLTEAESEKLSRDFPSGNFLYHGAVTEQLIKIIDSGGLVNAKALYDREEQAAKAEGRESDIVRRNTGV